MLEKIEEEKIEEKNSLKYESYSGIFQNFKKITEINYLEFKNVLSRVQKNVICKRVQCFKYRRARLCRNPVRKNRFRESVSVNSNEIYGPYPGVKS